MDDEDTKKDQRRRYLGPRCSSWGMVPGPWDGTVGRGTSLSDILASPFAGVAELFGYCIEWYFMPAEHFWSWNGTDINKLLHSLVGYPSIALVPTQ